MADPLSEVGQVRELESVLDYHVGEVVTSITNVKLGAQGTREVGVNYMLHDRLHTYYMHTRSTT